MGRGCAETHLFFLFFYSRDGRIRGFSRFGFLGFLSASFYSLFFRPLGARRRTVIGIDPYDFYNIYWLVNTIISSIKQTSHLINSLFNHNEINFSKNNFQTQKIHLFEFPIDLHSNYTNY